MCTGFQYRIAREEFGQKLGHPGLIASVLYKWSEGRCWMCTRELKYSETPRSRRHIFHYGGSGGDFCSDSGIWSKHLACPEQSTKEEGSCDPDCDCLSKRNNRSYSWHRYACALPDYSECSSRTDCDFEQSHCECVEVKSRGHLTSPFCRRKQCVPCGGAAADRSCYFEPLCASGQCSTIEGYKGMCTLTQCHCF